MGRGRDPTVDGEFTNEAQLRMKQVLNKQHSQNNPSTYSGEFLKRFVIDKLLGTRMANNQGKMKTYLLGKAKAVDDAQRNGGELTLRKQLMDAIPDKVNDKIAKVLIVDIMIGVWRVLRKVIYHPQGELLDTHKSRDLQDYTIIMEMVESNVLAALEAEKNCNVNAKPAKLPPGEMERGYLKDGAKKPNEKYQKCPCCAMLFMHEPPENKAVRQRNNARESKFVEDNEHLDNYRRGLVLDPPKDDKGKPLKAIKPPKLEDEILACKGYSVVHSKSVDGYKCPKCSDRSCDTCKNKCSFACTKK